MKKMMITAISMLMLSIGVFARHTDVNEKVLKSFKESFPKAEQVSWQEYVDTYVVNFTSIGIKERITYDKEGNFISSTRYYYQENLPANIICKIKKNYPSYKVFGVTEVTTENLVQYYVKMEDDANWTTVKSDDAGNMEVVEKYKKTE
jgi:hypothetical protein